MSRGFGIEGEEILILMTHDLTYDPRPSPIRNQLCLRICLKTTVTP